MTDEYPHMHPGDEIQHSDEVTTCAPDAIEVEAPLTTDLVVAGVECADTIEDEVMRIAQREAIIEKHLTYLRAEVASSLEEEEVAESEWLDITGKEEKELKAEAFAKFETLEETPVFDTFKYRRFIKPILTALTVTTALVGAVVYFIFFTGGVTRVPDLIGLTSTQATATLRESGLSVGEIIEEENPNVGLGIVLNQDPKVDRIVPRGSTVTLIISSESQMVSVPNVAGLDVSQAREILNMARLTLEEVPTYDTATLAERIVGQLPVSDTLVMAGSTVSVLVSQGPAGTLIPTPRVMGLSAKDAEQVLQSAGFIPLPYFAATTFGKTGEIVAQTPASGMLTYPGSPIQYLVSESVPGADSNVPDTVGMRDENAKLVIEEAGFQAVFYPYIDSEATVGTVVAQMPLSHDMLIRKGDIIELLVVRGNDIRAEVPDVLDQNIASAREQLRKLGFIPIEVPLPSTVREGNVYQQFPARGTDYYIGLPILLYAGAPAR